LSEGVLTHRAFRLDWIIACGLVGTSSPHAADFRNAGHRLGREAGAPVHWPGQVWPAAQHQASRRRPGVLTSWSCRFPHTSRPRHRQQQAAGTAPSVEPVAIGLVERPVPRCTGQARCGQQLSTRPAGAGRGVLTAWSCRTHRGHSTASNRQRTPARVARWPSAWSWGRALVHWQGKAWPAAQHQASRCRPGRAHVLVVPHTSRPQHRHQQAAGTAPSLDPEAVGLVERPVPRCTGQARCGQHRSNSAPGQQAQAGRAHVLVVLHASRPAPQAASLRHSQRPVMTGHQGEPRRARFRKPPPAASTPRPAQAGKAPDTPTQPEGSMRKAGRVGTESRAKAAHLRGKEGREHLFMNEFLSLLSYLYPLRPHTVPTLSPHHQIGSSPYPSGF